MQKKLLKQWRKYVEKELIWCCLNKSFEQDTGKEIDQLLAIKLAQINNSSRRATRLKIFITEKERIMFLAAYIAGVMARADIFLCNPAWGKQEWQQVHSLAVPDLIFGDSPQQKLAHDSISSNSASMNSAIAKELDFQQPLIMIPTGGTSGKVRFVMHTWKTLSASVLGFRQFFDCPKINSFCTLPLYHVSGLMQFMRSFLTEGRLILCSYKAINKTPTFKQQDYFISLVPTQLQILIDTVPEYLTKFKTILLGGAPATPSLVSQGRKLQLPIALTYGMTETASGIVALKPTDFLAGNNSVGEVLPHAQITIKSTKSITETTFDNAFGLLKIKAASLSLGYYPHLFNSELITDDLGYFDQGNYLHLVGRNSQKIITGGENVFPVELENVIWSTKLVTDVCVIGINDRQWGHAITVIYVPRKLDHDLNLLKQQLRLQLANYKQPKYWIEVEHLPRNNRGKVNYQKLREFVSAQLSLS